MVDQSSGESRFAEIDLERVVMWRVLENFAARFHERERDEYRIRAQTRVDWYELGTRGPTSKGRVPIMKRDLLLESGECRIILDTKYYKDGGLGEEPDAKLNSGNLYQLFAYVVNRQRTHPEGPTHEGTLLYPTVGRETRVDFTTHDLRFQARSVDLGKPWQQVHEAMLSALA